MSAEEGRAGASGNGMGECGEGDWSAEPALLFSRMRYRKWKWTSWAQVVGLCEEQRGFQDGVWDWCIYASVHHGYERLH